MVTNNLDYCNDLLYGISGHQLLRIQRIQNTAARLILQSDRWSSARVMLNELHWLPVMKQISFNVLLVLYKAMHGLTPDYITVLATPYVPQCHLRSATDNLLVVPKTQLNYGDITFTVAAAKMWNKLPAVIKISGNVNIFKKNVKTHLFTQTMDYVNSHVNHCFLFVCYVSVFMITVLLLLCMLFLICMVLNICNFIQHTEQFTIELDISAIVDYIYIIIFKYLYNI